jgi:hypothetical protein
LDWLIYIYLSIYCIFTISMFLWILLLQMIYVWN